MTAIHLYTLYLRLKMNGQWGDGLKLLNSSSTVMNLLLFFSSEIPTEFRTKQTIRKSLSFSTPFNLILRKQDGIWNYFRSLN